MNWKISCEIFDEKSQNIQFENYFNFIGDLFCNIISEDPILGYTPIQVINSPNGHTLYWPLQKDVIKLGIGTNSKDIPTVCFKFAHLLCHIYIDPRVNNWFIESICNMAGLYIIKTLGDEKTQFPDELKYVNKDAFNDYYNTTVRKTFSDIDHVQQQHSSNWLKREIKSIKCVKDSGNPVINYMVAFELFPTFSGNPQLWESLKYYGKSTNPPPPGDTTDYSSSNTTCPDFELLKAIIPENIKDLTTEVINRIWD